MEAEIEISRRFKLALNEVELKELIAWYEERSKDEDLDDDNDLANKLYVQLKALRDGMPLNVESPPILPTAQQIVDGDIPNAQDPHNFARLRQSAGTPVVGGEWIERS